MTAPVKRMQLMASIVSAPLRATCRELRNFLPCWRELVCSARQHWPGPFARPAISQQTGGLFRKYAAILVALVQQSGDAG